MKTKSSSVLFVFVLLTALVAAVLPPQPVLASSPIGRDSSALAANQVRGYKLPWAQSYGKAIQVTGVRTSHTKVNNVPRQSIDFGTPMNTSIVAMKAGVVVTAKDLGNTGKLIEVDTQDGYCSVYLHLSSIIKSGGQVRQGEEIGKSGKLNTSIHTHIAVYQKNGSCEGYGSNSKTREAVIIFDEVGRELNYNDWVTSQNGNNSPAPLPTAPPAPSVPVVFQNGVSKLFQDQNWNRANLKVCADNLNGQTVYVDFRRDGRVFNVPPQKATSNCVTFWDMDAPGPMNGGGTVYYSRAALNQKPDPNWPIPCAGTTGGQGLCDAIQRP